MIRKLVLSLALVLLVAGGLCILPHGPFQDLWGKTTVQETDPLPSWNAGKNKSAILQFVKEVTREGGENYVPPAERIAVFDNDGTLWVEQPEYTQVVFAKDRLFMLSKDHPQWKVQQPFKAILDKDREALQKLTLKDWEKLIGSTHAGMSTTDFNSIASDWLATAKHPRFRKLYTKLTYLPMVEVISYLQKNKFKTFIVSGGGVDFMRAFAPRVYGIGPENIVGSSIKTKWDMKKNGPILLRLPDINFVDDGEGKPIGIELHIGLRPVIAFGNSDGDLQMLQWTAAGKKKRLMLLVHHDDGTREYKYDRNSPVGRLDKALDEADRHSWNVISMKEDWKQIFANGAK